MEEMYRLSGQNKNDAIFEILMQSLALQQTNAEILAEVLSKIDGRDINETRKYLDALFQKKRHSLRDYIYEHFGDLDMGDFLKT